MRFDIEDMNQNLGELTGLKKESPGEEVIKTTAQEPSAADPKTEVKPDIKTEVKAPEKQGDNFDFTSIKTRYNLPFENEEDFKGELSKLTEYKQHYTSKELTEKQLKELGDKLNITESERNELNSIIAELEVENPLGFLSPAQYKALKLSNDNPNLNSKVLIELSNLDLNEMDPFDICVKYTLLTAGKGYSESDVAESLAEDKQLDLNDRASWGPKDRLKFKLQADAVREKLDAMFSSVELPKKTSIEQLRLSKKQALEASYTSNLTKFQEQFNSIPAQGLSTKIAIKDNLVDINADFNYDYDPSFQESLKSLSHEWAKSGVEPTPEIVKKAELAARGIFLANNFEKITQRLTEDIYSKITSAYNLTLHNPVINTQAKLVTEHNNDNQEFLSKAPWGKKGNSIL